MRMLLLNTQEEASLQFCKNHVGFDPLLEACSPFPGLSLFSARSFPTLVLLLRYCLSIWNAFLLIPSVLPGPA